MNYNKNTCHYENNREMKDKDFINSPPKILSGIFKKDIPNEDFDCNPNGDCWCKNEPIFKGLPNGSLSDTCYSPKEIKRFQSE
jgi:hypothetical protein